MENEPLGWDPKGFDLKIFDLPFNFILDFVSDWIRPVACEKLTFDQEANLCWTNDFTHVYYIIYPASLGWSHDKEWILLVKHKNGYYIYLRAFHDRLKPYLINYGCIRYSKSWEDMWRLGLPDDVRSMIRAKSPTEVLQSFDQKGLLLHNLWVVQ